MEKVLMITDADLKKVLVENMGTRLIIGEYMFEEMAGYEYPICSIPIDAAVRMVKSEEIDQKEAEVRYAQALEKNKEIAAFNKLQWNAKTRRSLITLPPNPKDGETPIRAKSIRRTRH